MNGSLFEGIVRTVRQPLLVLDEELRVVLANRSFYTTFQVTEDEVSGRVLFDLGNGQWDIPALRRLMQEVLPEHSSFEDFEVRHDFPSVGYRIVLLNAREVVEFAGARSILLAIEDVTQRRKAEAETQELMSKLQRINSELQDFAHVASHDLQEPLRKIQAFGDRLSTRTQNTLDTEARMYLERMLNATERMQQLINDLLQYARLDRRPDSYEWTDLSEVAREVLHDLESVVQSTGARIVIADKLGSIQADPLRMRQLMQNLLSNAIKFCKPGQSPEVVVDSTVIEMSGPGCVSAPDGVSLMARRIEVRDNGIGFDERYLDRIFSMFQRLNPRHAYEGSGVGLAVCRKIVERHGGSITAHSRPGEGASFIVTLPVQQGHSKAA
jgi:two-component system, chemotaxis family, CheB/CheR fusion protein